ncbi:hypothetical protein [Elizabethkingia meningoseptica]|uniref:hypothetical protein n=1 Tax=Elizabethkingia meningoseptica TaxID=238 RepID=UPI002013BC2D|nr:hypothetical protein [Elizabethkingia meningoseptica]MCL1676122.1 hypothetical protein [Elizabethkingia meningoseptica]MCL1684831.1 hypothetical protein [Elizabethkingia meningoseptica]
MRVNSEVKKTIVLSLISSAIFLIFLQPILTFLWNLIEKISLSTYSALIDNWYKNASLGQRNWVDYIIFSVVFISFPVLTYTFRILNYLKDKRRTRIKRGGEREIILGSNLINFKKINDFVLAPLSLIFIIYIITFAFADLNLNTSFNQRLNALKPYIDDQQEEIFISKWALMKNKKDFEAINEDMERIAEKNRIILPENLLK